MNSAKKILGMMLFIASLCACSETTPPARLTYLALNRPVNPIRTNSKKIEESFPRGGFYFLNYGFRPAPNLTEYLTKADGLAAGQPLRDVDVELHVPFAFDIILFGYNNGTDTVVAGK